MQILLGIILAAVIGVAVHFVLPGRATRGVVLAPAVAVAAGAVSWTVCTWAGLGVDSPLIWLAAVVVPAAVSTGAVLAVTVARARADVAERERLRIG